MNKIRQFVNSSIRQFVNSSIRQFVNSSIRQFIYSSCYFPLFYWAVLMEAPEMMATFTLKSVQQVLPINWV